MKTFPRVFGELRRIMKKSIVELLRFNLLSPLTGSLAQLCRLKFPFSCGWKWGARNIKLHLTHPNPPFPEHAEESHNCLIVSSQTVALPDGFGCSWESHYILSLSQVQHFTFDCTLHENALHPSFERTGFFFCFRPFTGSKLNVMTWYNMTKLLHWHFLNCGGGNLPPMLSWWGLFKGENVCEETLALLTSNYVAFCGRLPLATSISFLSPDGAQGMWADYVVRRGFLSGSSDKLLNRPCSRIKPLRLWPVILY